jgi:hypothetical protein
MTPTLRRRLALLVAAAHLRTLSALLLTTRMSPGSRYSASLRVIGASW